MGKQKEFEKGDDSGSSKESEPKASKGKPGEIKFPVMIGIIVGILIILIVAVRFLFLPYLVDSVNGKITAKDSVNKHTSSETKIEHSDMKKGGDDEPFPVNEKLTQFIETGRITTNPKSSTQFIVVNLGLTYAAKNEDVLKELNEGKGKESKDAPAALPPKIMARIKGSVNSVLGSLSVEELQSKRDSLSVIFKNSLKPVFHEKDLFLKEVILQEFIIQ